MPKTWQEFKLGNKDKPSVRLTYVGDDVTNIEIKLTREERRLALCKLADDKINFKNSAYTYVLQGFIAKYMGESEHEMRALEKEIQEDKKSFFNIFHQNRQDKLDKIKKTREWATYLHKLSAHFIELEYFVNNAAGDSVQRLDDFEKKFIKFQTDILKDLDDFIATLKDDDSRKKILIKLRKNISDNAESFSKQFIALKKNPNKQDLDCLLSIADRAFFIKSLGTFMREEMSCILDAGIKVGYKISHNRLRDVIQVPRLVAFLSDAEHILLLKGQSIVEGPKENDTYSAMPKEMLESLTGTEILDADEELYFSLNPYLKKMHPKYLDEILCLLTRKSRDDNSLSGNYFYHFFLQPLKLLASVFEIAFSIPRFLAVIALGLIEAAFSPFSSKPNSEKITGKINQYISKFYDKFAIIFAPLTYLQNIEASRYKRIDSSDDDHQTILDECADYSSYSHRLFKFFTPQLISTYIHEFFLSLIASVNNFFVDLKYLFTPASHNQEVYAKVAERYKALKLLHGVFGEKISASSRSRLGHLGVESEPRASASGSVKDYYDSVVYCDTNDIKSPLDVFYEIAVVLSNDVVNPMFRKSPGIATFYFALSMLTFGTLVLPSTAFAWMKPLPSWLQYIANKISVHFTGKPTSAGLMEQSVACFLEWKLGFFSTEFVVEMLEGHYEILEKLFEEPEQIVLGLVGLVGLGMSLQYIPELPNNIKIPGLPAVPNPYFIIINTFTEESKSCADGTLGLTSIEYGFLGLKFAMLLHSMLSNSEREEAKLTEIEKLALVLQQKNFFAELLKFCREKELVKRDLKSLNVKNEIKEFIKTQLPDENFSDYCIAEFAELLLAPNKKQSSSVMHKNESTVAEARAKLTQAIQMVADKNNNLLLSRSVFGVNKEAHQLYDYLDSLFEEYNAAIKREHPNELNKYCIDKRPFLDIFFNKYIYKRSNNFVRSFLLIFYPIPVILRSLKYIWATITHKPSMQHQVVKNFSKDLVILSQIFTPVARIVADFNLYLSGVLRALAFLVILPIAGLIFYPLVETAKYLRNPVDYQATPFSKWFEVIDEYICKYIALHKTPALQPIRQLLVRAARVAGVNTNLSDAADKVFLDMDALGTQEVVEDSYVGILQDLGIGNTTIKLEEHVAEEDVVIVSEISTYSNSSAEIPCNFSNSI